MDDVLTLVELAERLKIPVSTARKLVVSRKVRGLKVGNRWRVMASDVTAYLDHQRALASGPTLLHARGGKKKYFS